MLQETSTLVTLLSLLQNTGQKLIKEGKINFGRCSRNVHHGGKGVLQ